MTDREKLAEGRAAPSSAPADSELDSFTTGDWALLIGLALVWGSSFLFIDIGLRHFAPAQIAFLRLALGAGALAVFPASRRPVPRDAWPRLGLLGLLWMGLPFLLFPVAQQWIDSSLAGMLNGGVPLWSALVATLVAHRLPPRGVLIGLAAGFVGIILISLPTLDTEGSIALGAGLVLVATILYGIALNLAVPLQRAHGSLPVQMRAQGLAALMTMPVAAVALPQATLGMDSVLAVTTLGVVGTGAAMVMMTTLAGRVGAARGSIAIYLVPVVAIILGVVLLGEQIAVAALVGTALVIVGAAVTSRSQRARVATIAEVDAAAAGLATD